MAGWLREFNKNPKKEPSHGQQEKHHSRHRQKRRFGSYAHPPILARAYAYARVRIYKTEYISCPGCGRTLFELEETIRQVKAATKHLTGLKIAIMGCIVNGPGRGRVSLYRGKECILKNIPQEEAVEQLLALIEADKNEN